MSATPRTKCAACESNLLLPVLSLPETPLANGFQKSAAVSLTLPRFPLTLQACQSCGHVQLEHVVDPALLFTNYAYASGTSASFRKHFDDYAEWAVERFKLTPDSLVVEIGSNDGTLLEAFKRHGMRVVGVEPGGLVAEIARSRGIPTVSAFWDESLANHIYNDYGKAHLVCANNVLAHVPDLHDVLLGVGEVLDARRGAVVCEVQYLQDLVNKRLFDMIYHEHMHYHSARSMERLFRTAELHLHEVTWQPTHGGSIRCVASVNERTPGQTEALAVFIADETAALPGSKWDEMRGFVSGLSWQVNGLLNQYAHVRGAPARLVGFGAPAKATTLLSALAGLRLEYVVDDSPLKQGLFLPGTSVEIRHPRVLEQENPSQIVMLILAWNFAPEIMKRYEKFHRAGGRFLIPLPQPRLV